MGWQLVRLNRFEHRVTPHADSVRPLWFPLECFVSMTTEEGYVSTGEAPGVGPWEDRDQLVVVTLGMLGTAVEWLVVETPEEVAAALEKVRSG